MARVVKIGDRNWVLGMSWMSFENVPSDVELREDAVSKNASWASLRVSEASIQAGFCAPIEGMKKPSKLFSLAAMLADSKEQPWLGIFKIEEGVWWYIAVRDGYAILPMGDVIGGEQEIRRAQDEHASFSDWKFVEGDISLLEELINSVDAKPTKVKSLVKDNSRFVAPIAAVVAVCLLGGGGIFGWKHFQSKKLEEADRVAKFNMMREALKAQAAKATSVLPGSKPVEVAKVIPKHVLPNDFLNACRAIRDKLPLFKNGWSFTDLSCGEARAVVHWSREEGATISLRPEGLITKNGEGVEQSIMINDLPMVGLDDAIDFNSEKLALLALSQFHKAALSTTDVAPVQANPDQPVVPMFKEATVKMDFARPFDVDFSVVKGFRITSMNSTETGWHLEGVLYGR